MLTHFLILRGLLEFASLSCFLNRNCSPCIYGSFRTIC
nr:MAG TPA: hypothetical protein [Caudoviricetes sp.]